MKIRKIILCVAAGLTAFGASVGLFELGRWLSAEPADEYCQTENKTLPDVRPVVPLLTSNNLPPPATVSPTPAEPLEVSRTEPTENDADDEIYENFNGGDFYIIGELPAGFKDFEALSFWAIDYKLASAENNYQDVHIAPEGFVQANHQFNFVRVSVSPKRLKFETETIKGISYKFNGKFVDEKIDMGRYTAYALLAGTLAKLRNGKKIAEIKVKFEAGGC